MIRAYPNGIDVGAGTHLSVFVCLQHGEFDDQLEWPFNGEIVVEAYNRSKNKWSEHDVLNLSDDCCGVEVACKPKMLHNLEYGIPDYISHKEMKQHYLTVVGSTVSMRVVAVKLFHA